ncbi:MAG TPA: hypothetical protein VFA20_06490 [Myxococcaceae bacterium]|nr:hypothetical protein [Myxococcaceae bacterium]
MSDAFTPRARPTTAGRLMDYIAAQFPPAVYVPSSVASFLSVYLSLQALALPGRMVVSLRAAAGAASVLLFMLLLRVNDELKDLDSDRRLASEGDARYVNRPTVTGRVRPEDLHALRALCTGALVVLNVAQASLWVLLGFAVTYGVIWLSARWFFWPAIRSNLLLAFATHNPITLVVGLYVMSVFAADFGAGRIGGGAPWVILTAWLPVAAWELSRKVRPPGAETSYQTYSSMLGWKVAAWLPAVVVSAGAACALQVAGAVGLGRAFPVAVVAAALVVIGACARFRLRPTARSANLRPVVELFALVTTVGLPVALVIARGWTFTTAVH